MAKDTTLGPVVSLASASRIRKQVKDAVKAGAEMVLDETHFPNAKDGTTLVGPQVLVNVNHGKPLRVSRMIFRSSTNRHGRDDGGDLWASRGHHEGRVRRGSFELDERFSLRLGQLL